MVKLKKSISLVLSIATLSVMSIPCFAASNISNSEFFDCESIKQFENISFEEAKLIKIESDRLDTKSQKKVIDLVGKGTDIFIECERDSNTAKTFYNVPEEYSEEKADNFLGVYLRNDNGEVKASPLTFVCMYPEDEEVSKEEKLADYKNIKENPDITADELYVLFGKDSNCSMVRGTLETQNYNVTTLVAGDISKLFYHQSILAIAYYNSKEKENWKYEEDSSYKKLGYAEIDVQMYKIGNALNRNYDAVVINSAVGTVNNYYVVSYGTNYVTTPYITFISNEPTNTSNRKVVNKYSTTVKSDGTLSNEFSVSTEINPDGQTFALSRHPDDLDVRRVIATPASRAKNKEWQCVQTAEFSTPLNEKCVFMAGIVDVKIKNWKTYTWDEDTYNPALIIAVFSNHKETTLV